MLDPTLDVVIFLNSPWVSSPAPAIITSYCRTMHAYMHMSFSRTRPHVVATLLFLCVVSWARNDISCLLNLSSCLPPMPDDITIMVYNSFLVLI